MSEEVILAVEALTHAEGSATTLIEATARLRTAVGRVIEASWFRLFDASPYNGLVDWLTAQGCESCRSDTSPSIVWLRDTEAAARCRREARRWRIKFARNDGPWPGELAWSSSWALDDLLAREACAVRNLLPTFESAGQYRRFAVSQTIGMHLVAARRGARLAGWLWRWWAQAKCVLTVAVADEHRLAAEWALERQAHPPSDPSPALKKFVSGSAMARLGAAPKAANDQTGGKHPAGDA